MSAEIRQPVWIAALPR